MTTTVLHVTECYDGGIPVAIEAYVRNSPLDVEHHLLVELPDGVSIDDARFSTYRSVSLLRGGPAGAVASIRRARRQVGADIVHAHSSFAGAYARLALRNSARTRIVYTPHCYAFERRDVSRPVRSAFRAVEWLLSFNVETIAACSEGEAAAARRRGPWRPRVVHVPNVLRADTRSGATRRTADDRRSLRISSVGRLAPQKDPARFAAAASAIRARGLEISPIWLGGGPVDEVEKLQRAGVEVSGWLPHVDVAGHLRASDVYLHTAAWEGFPLAVLEAVQTSVPTLVRRIDAFGELPDALTIEAGLEAMIFSRQAGAEVFAAWSAANLALWNHQLRNHTPGQQTEALADAYRVPVAV